MSALSNSVLSVSSQLVESYWRSQIEATKERHFEDLMKIEVTEREKYGEEYLMIRNARNLGKLLSDTIEIPELPKIPRRKSFLTPLNEIVRLTKRQNELLFTNSSRKPE